MYYILEKLSACGLRLMLNLKLFDACHSPLLSLGKTDCYISQTIELRAGYGSVVSLCYVFLWAHPFSISPESQ